MVDSPARSSLRGAVRWPRSKWPKSTWPRSKWPKSKWAGPVLAVVVLLAGYLAYVVVAALSGGPSNTVPPAPAGWTTVFQDNFSGPAGRAPSTANWDYALGTGYGNHEVEHTIRSTSNVFLDGSGDLVIRATRVAGQWNSGRLESARDNFAAPPGGKLEMTASLQLPSAAHPLGYWPAFWALGAGLRTGGSWPSIGEIDMMEDINGLDAASQGLHDAAGSTGHLPFACPAAQCLTGYHTFSVIIDRTSTQAEYLTLLMDGQVREKITEAQVGVTAWQQAIDHGFYIILNLAMGGDYPNVVCHCTTPTAATTSGAALRVGYVAVYQKAAQAAP